MKISKKQILFKTVLPELMQQHPYIPFDRIKRTARGNEIENDGTLYDYLGQAVESGILAHAGRGWCTRNQKTARFDDRIVQELKVALDKRFQLIDEAEYRQMVHKLLDRHRMDLARLLRLLGDRKRKTTVILSEESTQYLGIF